MRFGRYRVLEKFSRRVASRVVRNDDAGRGMPRRYNPPTMKLRIAVLPGDGIGPEVMHETIGVLRALNLDIETHEGLVGGIAMDTHGVALTDDTLKLAQDADAVLFGAVGGPANSPWSNPNNKVRPEQAILGLRKGLALFANLRPVKVYDALIDASTLKPEIVRGVDMLILRELTGGCYFGKPQENRGEAPNREAVDTTFYTEAEVRRLMTMAFDLARGRRKNVVQADKANVMATGRLWRAVCERSRQTVSGCEIRRCAGRCAVDAPAAQPIAPTM